MRHNFLSVAALIAFTFYARVAHAGNTEFGLTIGASEIKTTDKAIDESWGPYFELSITTAPISSAPQFRIGGGIGFSYFSGEATEDFFTSSEQDGLLTPELLVSLRQSLGRKFFIEPGVGFGAVIGVVDLDWGAGYSVRPFLRLGVELSRASLGLEAGYRFGYLDTDDVGAIQNLDLAIFVNFKL